MLNPFPGLLDFELLAPFILRLVVGFVFIDLGYLMLTKEKKRWEALFTTFLPAGKAMLVLVAAVEIVFGFLIVIGLFTQVAALALILLTFANIYLELKNEALVKRDIVFHVMLFAMTLSLLFTGAGFLAFDLPL